MYRYGPKKISDLFMVGVWKKTTIYVENISSILVPLFGLKKN